MAVVARASGSSVLQGPVADTHVVVWARTGSRGWVSCGLTGSPGWLCACAVAGSCHGQAAVETDVGSGWGHAGAGCR